LIAQQAEPIEDVIALEAEIDFVEQLASADREDGDRRRVAETRSDLLTKSGHGDSHVPVLLLLQLATSRPTDPESREKT
jgi:hypothetical protein